MKQDTNNHKGKKSYVNHPEQRSTMVHEALALLGFLGALGSLGVSIKLGSISFLRDNFINGLCVDVWDGFFLSPSKLLAIAFLFGLPMHCYSVQAPLGVLLATILMGFPSYLFAGAMFLEVSPVVVPTMAAMGLFASLGLAEMRTAKKIRREAQLNTKSTSNSSSSSSRSTSKKITTQPMPVASSLLPTTKISPISQRKRRHS